MSNSTTLIEYLTTDTAGILMLVLLILVGSWIFLFLLYQLCQRCSTKRVRASHKLHYKLVHTLPI